MSTVIRETSRGNTENEKSGLALSGVIRETRSLSTEISGLAMSAVIRETSRGNTETEKSGLALSGVIRETVSVST